MPQMGRPGLARTTRLGEDVEALPITSPVIASVVASLANSSSKRLAFLSRSIAAGLPQMRLAHEIQMWR
jgi:hypothetical protein